MLQREKIEMSYYLVQETEGRNNERGTKANRRTGRRHRAQVSEWHPVNLDLATTKCQYITGMHALNLEDHQSGETGGTADWHEPAALWTLRPTEPGDHANVNVVVALPNARRRRRGGWTLRTARHPGIPERIANLTNLEGNARACRGRPCIQPMAPRKSQLARRSEVRADSALDCRRLAVDRKPNRNCTWLRRTRRD